MNSPIYKLLKNTTLALALLAALVQSEDSFAQRKKKNDPAPSAAAPSAAARPGATPAANGPKPYKEVITAKALAVITSL